MNSLVSLMGSLASPLGWFREDKTKRPRVDDDDQKPNKRLKMSSPVPKTPPPTSHKFSSPGPRQQHRQHSTPALKLRTSVTPQPTRDVSEPPSLSQLFTKPVFIHAPPMATAKPPTLGSLREEQKTTTLLQSFRSTQRPGTSLQDLDVYKTPLVPTRLRAAGRVDQVENITDLFRPRQAKPVLSKQAAKHSSKPYAGEGGMKRLLAKRKEEEDSLRKSQSRQTNKDDSFPPVNIGQTTRPSESSLRVGRTLTQRNHIHRPKSNRFSASYDDEDDERKTLEEAARRLPVFEIPKGFTFDNPTPIVHDESNAKEPPIASLPFSLASTKSTPPAVSSESSPSPPTSFFSNTNYVPPSVPPSSLFGSEAKEVETDKRAQKVVSVEKGKENMKVTPSVPEASSSALPTLSTSSGASFPTVAPPKKDGDKGLFSSFNAIQPAPAFSFPQPAEDSSTFEPVPSSTIPLLVRPPTLSAEKVSTTTPVAEATKPMFGFTSTPKETNSTPGTTVGVQGTVVASTVELAKTHLPAPTAPQSSVPPFSFTTDTATPTLGSPPATPEASKSTFVPSTPEAQKPPFGSTATEGPASPFGSALFQVPKSPFATPSANVPTSLFANPPTETPKSPFGVADQPKSIFGSIQTDASKSPFITNESMKSSAPATESKSLYEIELKSASSTPHDIAQPTLSSAFGGSGINQSASTVEAPKAPFSFSTEPKAAVEPAKAAFGSVSEKPSMFAFGQGTPSTSTSNFSFGANSDTSKPFVFGSPASTTPRAVTPPRTEPQDAGDRMDESPTRVVTTKPTEPRPSLGGGAFSFPPSSNAANPFAFTAPTQQTSSFATTKPEEPKFNFSSGFPTSSASSSSFGFGTKPHEDPPRPSTTGSFSFSSTPTTPFAFGNSTGNANTFGQPQGGSAPSSPSTFATPSAFTFGQPPPANPFSFGSGQPSSPPSTPSGLPPPVTSSFSFGAGPSQPTSPFSAPAGGTLFNMGSAPTNAQGNGARQIKKLPTRRGGKR